MIDTFLIFLLKCLKIDAYADFFIEFLIQFRNLND